MFDGALNIHLNVSEAKSSFIHFPGVEDLWKLLISAEFWAIRPNLCGNCTFPQNLHTKTLGKILVYCDVKNSLEKTYGEIYPWQSLGFVPPV